MHAVSLVMMFCYVIFAIACYCSGGSGGWRVFYHFVGAVPGSTELRILLHRILTEITDSNVSKLGGYIEDQINQTTVQL